MSGDRGVGDRRGRIRVVQVIARLNVGGPAALVLATAGGLDPARYESVVLHGEADVGEAEWLDVRGSAATTRKVRGLGRAVRAGDDVVALRLLVTELRRLRPDIVHTHTAKAGALGRVAAGIARVPATVHTFHGHVLHGYFSPRATRMIVGVERGLARRTDRIVTVGTPVRDDLLRARVGRPGQYTVISPGVDPLVLPSRDDARLALGVPATGPVIAVVGRLTGIKQPLRALDAFHLLRSRGVDAHLVMAGDGDLGAEVRQRAARMGPSVTVLGWTSDVAGVLAASDVILLTSDNEGMPVTLVEAAHAGVPAVATDVGGVGEVVADGQTGLLTGTDPADIATALGRLIGDPSLRDQMGEAAKVRAGERFTTEVMVRRHAEMYDELAP